MSDLIGRFGILLFRPNHTVADRLLLFLEQVLEDEWPPGSAACLHQCATLVEFPQLDGCEPEFFGQIRHGSDGVLVVARQKDDPVAAFDDRICCERGSNQVIEAFHELGTVERFRDESGGREAVQLFGGNAKGIRRVDDRLVFPARQGFRNFGMLFEQNRQKDCVGPGAPLAVTWQ